MNQSSIIKNRQRAKQLLAFDGMVYGKCKPTDIDLAIDFQGRSFVFAELKGNRAPLTLGQKIHLQGLVKAIRAGGRLAWAIHAHHNTPSCHHDVSVKDAEVFSVYDGTSWSTDARGHSLDSVINAMHALHNEKEGE
jgi:hypothetical protein